MPLQWAKSRDGNRSSRAGANPAPTQPVSDRIQHRANKTDCYGEPVEGARPCHPFLLRGPGGPVARDHLLGITVAHLLPSPSPPGVSRTEILKTVSLGSCFFQSGMTLSKGSRRQALNRVGRSAPSCSERRNVTTCPTTTARSHSGKRSQTT